MPLRSIMLVAARAAATPALAEEGRALCPDRPGLGTPACTVDVGAVVLEVGVADWTLDDNADSRTDSWAFGDTLLRAGLTPSLEVQVGWTMLGHVRERDRATGDRTGRTRTGDVTLALRQNLRSPDGSRSEEHTSELQSLMRISYAVFCLKKNNTQHRTSHHNADE